MLLVRKNKKIINLLLLLISHSLFASLDTEEIAFYYFTSNLDFVKEKTLILATKSNDTHERATALFYLSLLDNSYEEDFYKEAEGIDDFIILSQVYFLKKDTLQAKKFTYLAIEKIDEDCKSIFESRTWYNTKSIALHALKLNKRLLQSQLAILLIQSGQLDEGYLLLKASKGKKSDEELKITLEKLKKSITPPIRGKVGWTLEGFASLESAKELFLLENYFKYSADLSKGP
jgi:hypothetical protein